MRWLWSTEHFYFMGIIKACPTASSSVWFGNQHYNFRIAMFTRRFLNSMTHYVIFHPNLKFRARVNERMPDSGASKVCKAL